MRLSGKRRKHVFGVIRNLNAKASVARCVDCRGVVTTVSTRALLVRPLRLAQRSFGVRRDAGFVQSSLHLQLAAWATCKHGSAVPDDGLFRGLCDEAPVLCCVGRASTPHISHG